MKRVQFINYKNKEILLIDFKGLSAEKAIKNIELVENILLDESQKSNRGILILIDATKLQLNSYLLNRIQDFTSAYQKNIKASAIVGIKGLTKALINGIKGTFSIKVKLCDNLQEAKDWLVRV